MKKFFLAIFLWFLLFNVDVFAKIRIISILPNPEKGQAELIEIQNFGCEGVDIEGFEIRKVDTSKKQVFPKMVLNRGENFILETGNFLKNSGDTIELHNALDEKIESISFESVDKGLKIQYDHSFEECENDQKGEDEENDITSPNKNEIKNDVNNDNSEENILDFLEPEKGVFSDNNYDFLYETFSIFYPESLTGSVDVSQFFIFTEDNEGKNIFSGAIISASIDENMLVLQFDPEKIGEKDIKKYRFFIENTEGIIGKTGKALKPLFGESFDNYNKIEFDEIGKVDNSGSEAISELDFPSSDTTGVSEESIFPEISPFLQRATDAVLENNVFYCTKNPCRINLNFEENFSQNFQKEKFSCLLRVDDETYNTCNPPQLSFEEKKNIVFELKERKTEKILTQIYELDFSRVLPSNHDGGSVNKTKKREYTSDLSLPEAKISSRGKFDKEYKWVSHDEIECFYSPCKLNLTASGSVPYERGNVKYFWQFGDHIERVGKNPSTVLLETGEYKVILKMQDSKGFYLFHDIFVSVPDNKREEKVMATKEKMSKKKNEKHIQDEDNEYEVVDFSRVELILQNPKNFQNDEENFYICTTKSDQCGINFALENVVRDMRFYWGWNNEVAFVSKNPRTKNLPIGEHVLIIQGYDIKSPEIIAYEKYIKVLVEKDISPGKKRKKSSNSQAGKSNKKQKIITEKQDNEQQNKKEKIEEVIPEIKDEETPFLEMITLSGILFLMAGFWGYRSRKNAQKNL